MFSYNNQLAREGETVSANLRVSKVVTVLVVIDLCLSVSFNVVIFSSLKNNTLYLRPTNEYFYNRYMSIIN